MSALLSKLLTSVLSWLWGTIDQKIKENQAEEDRTARRAAEAKLEAVLANTELEKRLLAASKLPDARTLSVKLRSL